MKKRRPELAWGAQALLGEGAFWDAHAGVLYWVDILNKEVKLFSPLSREKRTIPVDGQVATIVPTNEANKILIAMNHSIALLDIKTERIVPAAELERNLPENRCNDGKCDPGGRFWIGTMNQVTNKEGAGSLYCLDHNLNLERKLSGVTISNGIVWTVDKRTMYYIDTPTRKIQAFQYNDDDGSIEKPCTVIEIPKGKGFPDGMTIDSENKLWIALWEGHSVERWDPASGELLEHIEIPAKNVTSCALGGEDFRTLYVTTARTNTSVTDILRDPESGGLFSVSIDIPGVPGNFFNVPNSVT